MTNAIAQHVWANESLKFQNSLNDAISDLRTDGGIILDIQYQYNGGQYTALILYTMDEEATS